MKDSKLAEIEGLAFGGRSNINRLIDLCGDDDEEVRFRAIEALGGFGPSKDSQTKVVAALRDPDELVRTAAVETLGNWRVKDAVSLLVGMFEDASEFVRSAAIVSLGEIGSKQAIWDLERRCRASCSSDSDKLSCAVALYVLGRSSYLDKVLEFLKHDNYQLRCASANLLRDFTATEHIPIVLAKLRSAIHAEPTKAAESSMSGAIDALSDS